MLGQLYQLHAPLASIVVVTVLSLPTVTCLGSLVGQVLRRFMIADSVLLKAAFEF